MIATANPFWAHAGASEVTSTHRAESPRHADRAGLGRVGHPECKEAERNAAMILGGETYRSQRSSDYRRR